MKRIMWTLLVIAVVLIAKVGLCDDGGLNCIPTPEPISSALFLIGGGALAAYKLRKKK